MQIVNDRTEVSRFLGNFAISLTADPESWRDWLAVIIHTETERGHALDDGARDHICAIIRGILTGQDGIILNLGTNTIMTLFQRKSRFNLRHFKEELESHTTLNWSQLMVREFPVLNDIDALEEYAGVYATLHDRMNDVEFVEYETLKSMVPHISDLLKAWMTTSKKRSERTVPHLLVVDDDAMTRHIVAKALKDDYPVVTAASVPEAIEKHLLLTPDIVFLDIDMPGCDGFTLLNYIRAFDPHCRVIMFSSNSYVDNRVKAFVAGASGFVCKPFNRQSFERYITMYTPAQAAQGTAR